MLESVNVLSCLCFVSFKCWNYVEQYGCLFNKCDHCYNKYVESVNLFLFDIEKKPSEYSLRELREA